jgi:hypothetical protein
VRKLIKLVDFSTLSISVVDSEHEVMDPDPVPAPELDLNLTKNHQKNLKFYYYRYDIKKT